MGKTTFIAAGVAMTLFLAGCGKEKEKEAEPVRPVQLIEVQRGSIPRIITADGILRALDQSAITPKLSAPVSKFFVNRGDHVKKG